MRKFTNSFHTNFQEISHGLDLSVKPQWEVMHYGLPFDLSPLGFNINHRTKGGPVENPNDPPIATTEKTPKVLVIPYTDTPDRWSKYSVFAYDFDGYAAYPDNLGELANQAIKDWNEHQILPDGLKLLRSFLFYESRRARFVWGYPSELDMGYLDAIVDKIKTIISQS